MLGRKCKILNVRKVRNKNQFFANCFLNFLQKFSNATEVPFSGQKVVGTIFGGCCCSQTDEQKEEKTTSFRFPIAELFTETR